MRISGLRTPRRALRLVAAALASAALGCGAPADGIDRSEGAPGLRGREIARPFAAPAFELLDTEGHRFDFRAQTAGSLTLLFFGYTSCPDICPVQMAVLDAALDDLAYAERRAIKVVFVTTDPARDTPERLRAWLDHFDPAFVGLRGGMEAVNAALAGFGLPPAIIEGNNQHPADPDEPYEVGHATPVVAITGDGVARALYPAGVRQTDWRHDLPLLLRLHRTATRSADEAGG